LYVATQAADTLKAKYGLDAELIDLRTLVPLNYEPIIASAKKTGRVLLASDACQRNSYMNDVASNITEMAFDYLDAPPVVVGSRNWITPGAELEKSFFPQPSWLIDAIHERILPLSGHQPTTNQTEVERLRLQKMGV